MDVAGFETLLTREGRLLLDTAMAAYGDTEPLALNQRLRALRDGYPAEVVAAALTQISLRRSGVAKFGSEAARMYFTPAGLEQATHPVVARHRVSRAGTADGAHLVDLGCGIGSDLVAFARAGFEVLGIDSDPVTAAVARANLAALGLTGSVMEALVQDVDLRPYGAIFADPARRRGTARVFDPRGFSPSWEFVESLLADPGHHGERRRSPQQQVMVKLAPGLDHDLIPRHVEAEWVSLDGELKEAVLWSPPPEPNPARRRATVLSSRVAAASCSDLDTPDESPAVSEPGQFLYEPDAAVIRAHLVSSVAAAVDGWLVDPHIAYVSSDHEVRTPFARGFRVLDRLPYKEKALRAALRHRNIGTLTIKKRGVAVTPEDLRRRLALRGAESATLVLTRTPGSAAALLVEPLQ